MAADRAQNLNIAVFRTLDAARPALRALAVRGGFSQSENFISAWLSMHDEVTPFFIAVSDATGAPLALLPLCQRTCGPLRIAGFIGGKDSNLNLPLRRADFTPDGAMARDILRRARKLSPDAPHIYALDRMPALWRGAPTLFAQNFCGLSPEPHFSTELGASFELFAQQKLSHAARKKQRAKLRRLAELGAPKIFRAQGPQCAAALAGFFAFQRAAPEFLARATTGEKIEDFYRRLAQGEDFELHVLALDEKILAVFGAGRAGDVLQGQFIGYDRSPEIARNSPGELLLAQTIADAFTRNIAIFELGVGDARYKRQWCDASDLGVFFYAPNFVLALTVVPLMRALTAARQKIKRRPGLLALARRVKVLVEKRDFANFWTGGTIDRGDEAL